MKRKKSSELSNEVKRIANGRRKYRLLDIFLGYEEIYETGEVLKKRFRNCFERAVSEAMGTGRRSGRILDLGTPFGMCGVSIARQNPNFRIISLQEGKKLTEISRKFADDEMAEIKWGLGRPEEIPFRNESFDMVISSFSIHKWGNPAKTLKETERVLKGRGKVVILDVRGDRWKFVFLPSLIYSWLSAGLWLFRRIRLAFKSSYSPKEIEKVLKSLKLKKWKVKGGVYYLIIRKG